MRTKESGLEGGVLPRGPLPVVVLPHGNPVLLLGLVEPGDGGNGSPLAGDRVLHFVHLSVLAVYRPAAVNSTNSTFTKS